MVDRHLGVSDAAHLAARDAHDAHDAAHSGVRDGLLTGLVGAVAVAVWFLIVDSIAGRPLHTPALLGALLAGSADAAADAEGGSRIGYAAVYTFFHLLAFAIVGVLTNALVHRAERTPSLLGLLLMLFAAVEVAFIALVALLELGALGSIAWYQVALGNVVAALAMGWYLMRTHPHVGASVSRAFADDG